MKYYDEKVFEITPELHVVCHTEDTRYGFRHLARISSSGDQAKVCYYNRTWEAWTYQSVIRTLADKAVHITPEERQAIRDYAANDRRTEVDHFMNSVAMVASLGSLMTNTPAESNDWKLRMIKAGLENRGLDIPADWDTLTEEEKTRRLDGAISVLKEPVS